MASTYPSPLDSLTVDDHMFWRGLFVYISLLYIFCNIGYVSELQFISFQKGFCSVLQVSELTLCQCSISNHCNTSPVIKLCSFSLTKWKMIELQIVKQKFFFILVFSIAHLVLPLYARWQTNLKFNFILVFLGFQIYEQNNWESLDFHAFVKKQRLPSNENLESHR